MKKGNRSKFCCFIICLWTVVLYSSCQGQNKGRSDGNDQLVLQDFFGLKYTASGSFSKTGVDSIEDGLWQYSCLDNPFVFYGSYKDGLPNGDWNVVYSSVKGYVTNWNAYSYAPLGVLMSLPMQFKEENIDSAYLKLTTVNDSLGKITIFVGVRNPVIEKKEMEAFGANSEKGLTEKGYSFSKIRKEYHGNESDYFFGEYFMKDSLGKNSRLYNLYGYSPSQKYFIEFTLFHDGRNEELVKVIFNLIGMNLYVHNERFFQPYSNSVRNIQ